MKTITLSVTEADVVAGAFERKIPIPVGNYKLAGCSSVYANPQPGDVTHDISLNIQGLTNSTLPGTLTLLGNVAPPYSGATGSVALPAESIVFDDAVLKVTVAPQGGGPYSYVGQWSLVIVIYFVEID
jgi:hypothetical protein